jgi:outer membrane lipoprotein-sorting protein
MKRMFAGLAGVVLVAAACGGGDKAPSGGGAAIPSDQQDQLVSISAVLKQAAENTDQIDTMSGEFSMAISAGGESFTIGGSMLAEYPDRMFIEMDVIGQRLTMLMDLPDAYMRMGDEWFVVDLDDAGFDTAAFAEYMDNQGIIDLQQIAESLQGAEQLPNDEIDGKTYAHYRGHFGVAELLNDPATQQFLAGADEGLLDAADGTVQVDTWIDPATMLPRRVTMDMNMTMAGFLAHMSMLMTMDFLEFNGPVNIPDTPENARSISEAYE